MSLPTGKARIEPKKRTEIERGDCPKEEVVFSARPIYPSLPVIGNFIIFLEVRQIANGKMDVLIAVDKKEHVILIVRNRRLICRRVGIG